MKERSKMSKNWIAKGATLPLAVSMPMALGLAGPASAQEFSHYMWGGGWGTGGIFIGAVGMLLFWGGIIALIVLAVRAFTPGHSRAPANTDPMNADHTKGALSILSERYARGEIEQAEFNERRKILLDLDRDKSNLA